MLSFRLEITFSTSIGTTGVTKKLLHIEVVKNSAKDLFPGCIVLANVGPIEEKYLLKAFAILLASVRVSSPTINLLGKGGVRKCDKATLKVWKSEKQD